MYNLTFMAYNKEAGKLYFPGVLVKTDREVRGEWNMGVANLQYGYEIQGTVDDTLYRGTGLKDTNGRTIYEGHRIESMNGIQEVIFTGVGFEPFIGSMVEPHKVSDRYTIVGHITDKGEDSGSNN